MEKSFVAGDYTLRAVPEKNNVETGVAVTVNFKLINTTAVNDVKGSGIRVYPNPVSNGILFVELADSRASDLEIYNALGVLIHKEAVDGRSLIEMNIPSLKEKGMYFVRIAGERGYLIERVIVR